MANADKAANDDLLDAYQEAVAAPTQDSLTGLLNHGPMQAVIEGLVERSRRRRRPVSLILIDVDLFGAYNRRHGFTVGDLALQHIAEIIRDAIRAEDHAARCSHDVFAAALWDEDTEAATIPAERIRSRIADELELTVSVGVASNAREAQTADALQERAMHAVTMAKITGSNRVVSDETGMLLSPGKSAPLILIVDDDEKNIKLLEAYLRPTGATVARATDGEAALALIRRTEPDLVLLDVMMPEMSGFEVCRKIKSDEATRRIPVVLVTALDDTESRVTGIEAGAEDFLTKPPNRQELLARTRSLITLHRLNKEYASIENVLFALANAVEAKDSYTRGHTDRVTSLAVALGRRVRVSEDELAALRLGGILHDVGKIGVSKEVLNKPGALDRKEWEEMKSHTIIGYRICLPLLKTIGPALDIVRHHHEKLDGSSYPDGLRGDEVSTVARVMAVVDIYDALVTDRPYRKALKKTEALELVAEEATQGKLDQAVVQAFIQMMAPSQPDRRGSDEPDSKSRVVLVIEDDPLNMKLLRTLLRLNSYRVLEAPEAATGLKLAAEQRPDLILMDIQLPGMDGLEATKSLKGEPSLCDIPVVAVSSYAMPGEIDRAMKAGCVAYFTKPINTQTFADQIVEFIDPKGMDPG